MPFFLDGNPSQGEISEAVNYLLSNFSQSVVADPSTGQIVGPAGEVTGYLYKYIAVKYADSFDGTLNFSNVPTNRYYYGIRNTDSSTESTNPADYIWYNYVAGFGTTNFLWYIITGGRQISFQVSPALPNPGWVQDAGTAIDLDYSTTAVSSPANFVVIRVANSSAAPTSGEVLAAIGRDPIDGDLCIVNYNSGIYSIQYKYTSGWAIFQKVITGDLIVANSITATNIAASTITATQIAANTITAANMVTGTITAASGILADAVITSAKIADLNVETAKIANNAVTASVSQASSSSFTFTAPAGSNVLLLITIVSALTQHVSSGGGIGPVIASAVLARNGTTLRAFSLSVTEYYVGVTNTIYALGDGTLSYLDTGTGTSNTYTMSIPTGISTFNWTALITKK
jgi:hypothetical protein